MDMATKLIAHLSSLVSMDDNNLFQHPAARFIPFPSLLFPPPFLPSFLSACGNWELFNVGKNTKRGGGEL